MFGLSMPMPKAVVATMMMRRDGFMNWCCAASRSAARIFP
jgi:hypothetical protein